MANVFANLQKDYKPSRSPFDLSHYDVHTVKPAMLLPVFQLETLPGDYHEIQASNFLQSMLPLKTDALFSAKQNLDYYFVPFQQLWTHFPEFYAQVNDPQQYLNDEAQIGVPHVSLRNLLKKLLLLIAPENLYQYVLADVGQRPQNEEQVLVNEFFFGALRLLDSLGYGNFLPLFEGYIQHSIDISVLDPGSTVYDIYIYVQNGDVNVLDFDNYLTYVYGQSQLNVNPFRLGAYHRIWYNYYRNHYYDIDLGGFIRCINFDWSTFGGSSGDLLNSTLSGDVLEFAYHFLTVHTCPWKKDLYTGLLPSSQFGDVSVASLQNPTTIFMDDADGFVNSNWPVRVKGSVSPAVPGISNGQLYTSANADASPSLGSKFNINSGISILTLRVAEALQHWKENVLRNGVKTVNQFKAHFGVEPRYLQDWYPDFLGSTDGSVSTSRVTSNADTGQAANGSLGDVASNVITSMSQKKIEYHATDFGVILGIYYIRVEAQYNSFGIDEHNLHLEPSDYYIPEFQNVGLSPVFARSLDAIQVGPDLGLTLDTVLGHGPRFLEYKYAISKIHGPLFHDIYLQGSPQSNALNIPDGAFNHWVIPRALHARNSFAAPALSVNDRFYQSTSILDSVSSVLNDGTYLSDFLLAAFNFDVKSVRPMSVIGLPQY